MLKICDKIVVIFQINLMTTQSGLGKMQATLWALDLETGDTLWQTKLGEIYTFINVLKESKDFQLFRCSY